MKRNRIVGIDIIRISCALLIFMRHSITMFGCTYGSKAIDAFIYATTSPVMSLFFIVSGFSIHYNRSEGIWDPGNIWKFYKKRAITILPTYLLVHVIWLFFGSDSIGKWAVLSPLVAVGMQSIYPTVIGVLHFGGTWFISCIMFSYIVYPVIGGICSSLQYSKRILMALALLVFLPYIQIVGYYYQIGTLYTNLVFRCIEFAFGVSLAAVMKSSKPSESIRMKLAYLSMAAAAAAVVGWSLWNDFRIQFIGNAILVFLYPFAAILLIAAYKCRWKSISDLSIIKYASGLTYYFFIFQTFVWSIASFILKRFYWVSNRIGMSKNSFKIVSSFIVLVLISVLVDRFYDRPVKKLLTKRYLPSNDNSR